MAGKLDELKARGMDEVTSRLYRLGYTPKSLEETQRDVLWWTFARVQAGLNRRPLEAGWGIAWTAAGYAELVPVEVPKPGKGRVSVLIEVSAVSPGTERAQYLKLPNTAIGVLGRPGYSASGVVRAVGPGVSGISVGTRVAVAGAAHASLATVPASQIFKIPDSTSFEEAALIQLGLICSQGVHLGALKEGGRFAVVGAGAIGALALRLAARSGTASAVIATTDAKREDALKGGAESFLLADDRDAVSTLNSPVVFEATGNPEAIGVAAAAAAKGGKIVLLGSPRGVTSDLPIEAIREKRLEIVGAHVDTVDLEAERSGAGEDLRRARGESFVEALAGGNLYLDDLVGPAVDPREASLFYEELADRRDLVGAHFDWSRLGAGRAGRSSLVKPPNYLGKGMDPSRPIRRRRRAVSIFDVGDQLAGARGDLRVGMIGCGDIATHNSSGIAAAPNCRVTACFDPVARLAEDLAGRHDAVASGSVEELLDRSDIDAVVVSVPHHLHAPLAEMAIEAGKHVVVEKPQANTLDAALKMSAAADAAGVTLSVCFPQRYDAPAVVSRRLIDSGAIGSFEGAAVRLYLDKSKAYWLGGFSGRVQSDWRRSKERAGGGVLIMNLSHHIDLVRHLSGSEVDSVQAAGGSVSESLAIEDSISVGLRFDNGAIGNLSGFSAIRGTIDDEISLWGRDGHLMLSPKPLVYSLRAIDGLRTSRWQTFGKLPSSPMRAVYFARFGTAIADESPPDVTAADGLAVQGVIEAAYRSVESGVSERPSALIEGGP